VSVDGISGSRRITLSLAALGAIVGLTTPSVASAAPAGTEAAPGPLVQAGADAPDVAKIASYDGALQPNAYYCAPAATRIALSAHGHLLSFDALAGALGTTTAGTASIFEVTRVLNGVYGEERYESVELSHKGASGRQIKKLRSDVVKAINEGDPVVANIIGTITDTAGEVHSYNGGHYVTITGYADGGRTVTVTDPADRVGSNEYQVPLGMMADWISSRGYSA
jgi:hypothetical protein